MVPRIPLYLAFMCAVNASVIVNVFETDDTSTNGYAENSEKHSVHSCHDNKCGDMCRQNGFPLGGKCYAGHCQCNKVEMFDTGESTNNIEGDCNPLACDQLCRRIGRQGGVCVNGRCKCDIFDHPRVDGSYNIGDCNPLACDQLCRRIGRQGGVCVNGRCKCDIFDPPSVGDINDIQGGCNPLACDQLCRRIGRQGGVCIKDRCKCDIFDLPTADKPKIQACSNSPCDQMCRRMGYSGGDCVDDICKCHITMSKVIQIPLNNDVENRKEKLSDDNDAEGSELVACNASNCNDMCNRMNYSGGHCSSWKCTCY